LAPLSDPDEIAKLPGEWAAALKKIFDRFTPIVIGYGGNDGSLMGFLKELSRIEGGVFWCHREGDVIDPAIEKVVESARTCAQSCRGGSRAIDEGKHLVGMGVEGQNGTGPRTT
jgi:hypothetical protein